MDADICTVSACYKCLFLRRARYKGLPLLIEPLRLEMGIDQSRFFFFSSRRRHTRYWRDWSSDVCSSDLRRSSLVLARWYTYDSLAADASAKEHIRPTEFSCGGREQRTLRTFQYLTSQIAADRKSVV